MKNPIQWFANQILLLLSIYFLKVGIGGGCLQQQIHLHMKIHWDIVDIGSSSDQAVLESSHLSRQSPPLVGHSGPHHHHQRYQPHPDSKADQKTQCPGHMNQGYYSIYIYSFKIYIYNHLCWLQGFCGPLSMTNMQQASPLQRVERCQHSPNLPSRNPGPFACLAQLPWPDQNLHPENLPMGHKAGFPSG